LKYDALKRDLRRKGRQTKRWELYRETARRVGGLPYKEEFLRRVHEVQGRPPLLSKRTLQKDWPMLITQRGWGASVYMSGVFLRFDSPIVLTAPDLSRIAGQLEEIGSWVRPYFTSGATTTSGATSPTIGNF